MMSAPALKMKSNRYPAIATGENIEAPAVSSEKPWTAPCSRLWPPKNGSRLANSFIHPTASLARSRTLSSALEPLLRSRCREVLPDSAAPSLTSALTMPSPPWAPLEPWARITPGSGRAPTAPGTWIWMRNTEYPEGAYRMS